MTRNDALIEKLNQKLNREVNSFLRYLVRAASIQDVRWESARKVYEETVVEEVGHAYFLARNIAILGGISRVTTIQTPSLFDVASMLEMDMVEKEKARAEYGNLARAADTAGFAELKRGLEEQADEEAFRAEEFRRVLA